MVQHGVDSPQSQHNLSRENVLAALKEHGVKFLRLAFTDILGQIKNIEVPPNQFEKALDGQIMFDGSSIQGFVRIEESDMHLSPDFNTFRMFPWDLHDGPRTARLICDVNNPDGSPFDGCPRQALKRQLDAAAKDGQTMMAGPEAEFFLFERDNDGGLTTITHDEAGYFDAAPFDRAENARCQITEYLQMMGLEVEAAHHEVAPGQHEIDFRYGNALQTADNLQTFKFVVRKTARDYGLHATFMPKPIFGINGSGMHIHLSLFSQDEKTNLFADPSAEWGISETGLNFIAGIIEHSPGICAITNPLVNSFKRLVPGYEAPTHIAWSMRNRSPMIRIPERRGLGTRMELRMPDPTCNPYLAFAAVLAAGRSGVKAKAKAPAPVTQNIYEMDDTERAQLGIKQLPPNLNMAVNAFAEDSLLREALGSHISEHFITSKREEWNKYIAQVHDWELEQYLGIY